MNLFFDFQVDKPAKKINITREFDAPQSLVWEAFTKAELLDQWTAPAPFKARTKYMDFKVGGRRFYAMVSPDGLERWALQEYRSINPQSHFTMYNCFTDADGNPDPTGSDWDYRFSESNGITTVNISIYNESFERMEALLEGFTKGFTMTLENLDALLGTLSKK